MRFTLADIATVTNGTTAQPDTVITGVTTDSRAVKPGDLFIAIAGETFDGHDFVVDALRAGAAAVCVSTPLAGPAVVVSDTLVALGDIARLHRSRMSAQVIGITGSSGKTSTKDILAQVLASFGSTIAPPGSFNNEIGLPCTVLSATDATRFLVLEMGMRGIGHISYLCDIAHPDVGVVLNVGSAHLELLGSREAIASAKSEIVRGLSVDGVAVLNADDPLVSAMAEQTSARVIRFGESPAADVRVSDVSLDERARASFTVTYAGKSESVTLRLSGEHQALNAAACIAVCVGIGLPLAEVCAAVSRAENSSKWRMEVTELPHDITLINDAYNANPESMRAGLRALKAMAQGRRTWAVLGEMREIGDSAVAEHDELGRMCVRLDINRLVAVGQMGKIIHMGAAQEGSFGNESQHVETVDAAVAAVLAEIRPGDVVFVKASRAVGLERVAEGIAQSLTGQNSPL